MASCLVGQQPGAHEAAHPPWAAFAVALSLALPAAAGNGRSVKGLISSISAHRVAAKGSNSIVTSCALARVSPSLSGHAACDPVQMVCRARKGRLVLARIRHLERSTAPVQNETAPTCFGGAITALNDSSFTVHGGDRDLTCALDASSPSTTDFELGQRVKVECAGGKLIAIAAITQADAGRYYVGTVNALDAKGLTLQTEHGLVTCTIGAGSPSTAELKPGDRIGMGCKASTMQLVLIRSSTGRARRRLRLPVPPPRRSAPAVQSARSARLR
jgi:hypothetical protein